VSLAALDWDAPEMAALVRAALEEDLGTGDRTVVAILPAEAAARARIVAKQELVLAGLPLAERVFRALDPAARIEASFAEGETVPAGAVVAQIEGRARAILSAERTALNFLGRLSGIATLTRRFVQAIEGTPARIRDTRKTTPLLRRLEKYAVRAGGGANHRFGLFDAVLIKENHIRLAGSLAEALRRARAAEAPETTAYESFAPGGRVAVQVEVRNDAELAEALAAGAESVLLDNLFPMDAARLMALARRERPGVVIEVSGRVNLANVRAYAEAGADFIAVGALTHSAPAADLSLLVE
jgi:nicotinate-nucleotide pyrophosphorylase (carboxylating)